MVCHYATRDFFRQMPNPLLARYFHARGRVHSLLLGFSDLVGVGFGVVLGLVLFSFSDLVGIINHSFPPERAHHTSSICRPLRQVEQCLRTTGPSPSSDSA